jgi:uncharacterized protein YbjT (DUF2867 family)
MLVREPARAAGLPPHAARVVADLGEPASLRRAFAGADRHRGLRPDARGHHRTFADWCARHAHAFGRPTAS